MALLSRDHKAVLALLEHAQLVYLLTRYPKKTVLDDAGDVTKLEQGLDAMRSAASDVSAATRERTPDVPWELLRKKVDGADLAWRTAKRVSPRVLAFLVPLVEGDPQAAFFLRPAEEGRAKKPATARRAPRSPAPASRRPAREGTRRSRRSPRGAS